MLWSEESGWAEMKNSVITFPIKKIIYAELFIDRGMPTVCAGWSKDQVYVALKNKLCGSEKQGRQPVFIIT